MWLQLPPPQHTHVVDQLAPAVPQQPPSLSRDSCQIHARFEDQVATTSTAEDPIGVDVRLARTRLLQGTPTRHLCAMQLCVMGHGDCRSCMGGAHRSLGQSEPPLHNTVGFSQAFREQSGGCSFSCIALMTSLCTLCAAGRLELLSCACCSVTGTYSCMNDARPAAGTTALSLPLSSPCSARNSAECTVSIQKKLQ